MQLRDAQTSELMAEGDPFTIATIAEAFAATDVLFDAAGAVDSNGKSVFDPAAVRKARADDLASLQATLAGMPVKAPTGVDATAYQQQRDNLQAAIKDLQDRLANGKSMIAKAKSAQDQARKRVARVG